MIDRYTPFTRERNANQPNTNATVPGTSTIIAIAQRNESLPCQNHGSCFQSRNTMKSGRSIW